MLVSRFGAMIDIVNSYGITEATIDSSYYQEVLEKLPESGNIPDRQAFAEYSILCVRPETILATNRDPRGIVNRRRQIGQRLF